MENNGINENQSKILEITKHKDYNGQNSKSHFLYFFDLQFCMNMPLRSW